MTRQRLRAFWYTVRCSFGVHSWLTTIPMSVVWGGPGVCVRRCAVCSCVEAAQRIGRPGEPWDWDRVYADDPYHAILSEGRNA